MASMLDVARLAGVSKATVSNTLNRPELVVPGTRERVQRAIEELGFIPNQNARRLSGASSQIIGLVVIDAGNPFFTDAARAVEEVAMTAGCVVVLCNSNGSQARERHFLELLAGQRVRGVLLSPAAGDAYLASSSALSELSVVYLDYHARSGCSVSVDDVQGGAMAARHLMELGARTIAFVGAAGEVRQHQDRWTGAVQSVRSSGVRLSRQVTDGIDIEAGVNAGESLLRAGELPEAIFCANDLLAFGMYRALARSGHTVPGDVKLIGYDDIDFAADWVVPLTSIRQPTRQLGETAATLLLGHAPANPKHRHRRVVLRPELVVRQSTGGGRAQMSTRTGSPVVDDA